MSDMLLHLQLGERGLEEGKVNFFLKSIIFKFRLVILARVGPAMVVLHTSVLRLINHLGTDVAPWCYKWTGLGGI